MSSNTVGSKFFGETEGVRMNRFFQIPDLLLLVPFRQCFDKRFRKVLAFGETLNLLDKFIGQKRGDFHGLIIR